jgi:hypothetical protein
MAYNENRPILDGDFKNSTSDLMNINSRFKISKIENNIQDNTISLLRDSIFYCIQYHIQEMKGGV